MSEVLNGNSALSLLYCAAQQQKKVKDFPSYFKTTIKIIFEVIQNNNILRF